MNGRSLLVCCVLGGLSGLAEEPAAVRPPAVVQVPFTATDEASAARGFPEGLSLALGGGLGFPKMDALNEYIRWANRTSSGNLDEIDETTQFYAGIGYDCGGGFGLGLGIAYLDAGTEGTTYFLGTPYHLEFRLDVVGIEASLSKSWNLWDSPFSLKTSVAGGHYWSSYRETESGYRASGEDQAWGARAMLGLGWEISKSFSLDLEVGYRWLKFDGYGVAWVSPGRPTAEADFSGPMAQAALTFRF